MEGFGKESNKKRLKKDPGKFDLFARRDPLGTPCPDITCSALVHSTCIRDLLNQVRIAIVYFRDNSEKPQLIIGHLHRANRDGERRLSPLPPDGRSSTAWRERKLLGKETEREKKPTCSFPKKVFSPSLLSHRKPSSPQSPHRPCGYCS